MATPTTEPASGERLVLTSDEDLAIILGAIRMVHERSGEVIYVNNNPRHIGRWKALGYEIDTDPPIRHHSGDEALWGKPNDWETNAPRNVHKLSGKR